MPGPGGKSVGRVSIRVVPDSTRFKADLKKSLDRIEKSTVLKIQLAIETRNAELALKRFQKDWAGKNVDLNADVKTAGATAHLRVLTRPRFVDVSVRLTKSSLAKASAILASLSGARLANDLVKELSEGLQNLDRSLPRLAKIALLVSNIGAAALASVGGLITVGGGLAHIGGVSLALPGILAGAGVAVGVLAVALSDAGKRLKALDPVWKSLKKTISDNFWAQAQKPIIVLVRGILPQLRSGVSETAKALGAWAATVSAEFGKAFGGGVLKGQFDNLVKSIHIASSGVGDFAQSIATLGTVGSAYLPRLAQWVANISKSFNDWLAQAASDGRLTGFIDSGIIALQQFGTVLHNTGSILSGLFHAADTAGGGLGSLGIALGAIATIVNSPTFQSTLSTLFQGAAHGMAGLATALAPVGNMFTALAPVLAGILTSSGQVVGDILGKIAEALSQPAFATGLSDFFAGIESGLQAIAPSLPAVAAALGSLGTFAGQLAAQLGPVLGAVLAALAPILTSVLDALTPLLPALGTVLVQAIAALAPVLGTIVTTLLPPLVALISALLPAIMPYINAILPIILAFLPPIMEVLNALLPIFAAIAPILGPLEQLVSVLLIPALALLTLSLKPIVAVLTLLGPLFQVTTQVVAAFAGILSTIVLGSIKMISQLLRGDFVGAAKTVGDVFGAIGGIVSGAFSSIGKIVSGVINRVIDLVNGAIGGINVLADGIRTITGGAINIHLGKLPHIPSLSMGATVLPTPGGTLVRAGEAGRAEDVVDHGLMNQLIKKALVTSDAGMHLTIVNKAGVHLDDLIELHIRQADGRSERVTVGGLRNA